MKEISVFYQMRRLIARYEKATNSNKTQHPLQHVPPTNTSTEPSSTFCSQRPLVPASRRHKDLSQKR